MKLGDPKEVALLIKRKRQMLGLSMREMGKELGVSYVEIFRLEHGQHGYIHAQTAKKLEALEIKRQDLEKRTMVLIPKEVHEAASAIAAQIKEAKAVTQPVRQSPPKLSKRLLLAVREWIDDKVQES